MSWKGRVDRRVTTMTENAAMTPSMVMSGRMAMTVKAAMILMAVVIALGAASRVQAGRLLIPMDLRQTDHRFQFI